MGNLVSIILVVCAFWIYAPYILVIFPGTLITVIVVSVLSFLAGGWIGSVVLTSSIKEVVPPTEEKQPTLSNPPAVG